MLKTTFYSVMALSAAVLAGCAQQSGNVAEAPATGSSTATEPAATSSNNESFPEAQPKTIINAWAGLLYDFEPVDSPLSLTDQAQLVATGELLRVVAGRLDGASLDDPFAARNIVLEIELTSVSKGSAEIGDLVWIEVAKGLKSVDEFAASLPLGLPVAAYLESAPESTDTTPLLTVGAEFPADVQLWSLVHPQGLTFGYDKSGIVTPLSHEVEPQKTVEDVVPAQSGP